MTTRQRQLKSIAKAKQSINSTIDAFNHFDRKTFAITQNAHHNIAGSKRLASEMESKAFKTKIGLKKPILH